MMKDCERADALVRAWEEGVSPSPEDLNFLESHASGCARCGASFARVLPFIIRDAGPVGHEAPSAAALAVADGVMDAILGGEATAPKRRLQLVSHGASRRWKIPLVAAAAAAVLALLWLVPTVAHGSDKVVVRFVVAEPAARSVNLVGDFTGWKGLGYAMHPDSSGRVWEIDIPLERGKVYLYNFVIDENKWTVDPAAIEKVDDGFGGSSALLRL